ncbi:MAG TPA: acetyl-CoA hydrolase/transferase C-terminal domain-containing protein [Acidimicrobiales bacterium]|jgi:acyl-CoA hydrolase
MPITCTPAEAVAHLRARDVIGFGLGPANPDAFLTALNTRTDWEDLILGGALLLNYYEVLTQPGVSYRCGFFGPAERVLLAQGHRIEHVPSGFRQFAPVLAKFAPRVMVAQAAPPDAEGRVNLSLHYGATRPELLAAGRDPERLLIVEVNPQLPRTSTIDPFDNTLLLDLIDIVVETDAVPFALTEPPPDDRDRAIAAHALPYIVDGATLQTGIGSIPNIIAAELAAGPLGGFGIHSEMFTTGLMELHRAGKVTNTNKGEFDGVSVTTFALGSAELHRWLDANTEVAFIDVAVLNDPTVISRNASFVSINGALAVDLYGQVVADSIDGRQISGVGGHEDFVAGAELHTDAHSLICLRSVHEQDGQRTSRIAGLLPEGAIVSTPRHHTGVVITEFGAAELNGLTVRERAHALADIAHPDFGPELHARADTLGYH